MQTCTVCYNRLWNLFILAGLLILPEAINAQVMKANCPGSNIGITVSDCIYTNDPAGPNYIDPLPGALIYYYTNEQDGSASRASIANGTHVYNPNPQTINYSCNPEQNYLYLTTIAMDSLYPNLSFYGARGHYTVNINDQAMIIDSTTIRQFVKGNIKRALKIPYTGSQVNIEVWGNIHTTDTDSLHWDPLPGLVVYGISNGQDGSDGFARVFEGTHPWKQQPDQFSFTSNSNTFELSVFPLHDTCTDQAHPYDGQYHIKVNNVEYIIGPERIIHLLCDTCAPHYIVEQPGPAPVLFMPFTGNADDLSGNNNHGMITGASFINDRFDRCNSAMLFDGVNDKIDVDPAPSLDLSEWTISCWVKPTGTPNGYNVIMGKNENNNNKYNYTLQIDPLFRISGGFEKCTSEYDHLIFSNAIPLNQWSFLVYTRSNTGELKLYVNGTLSASAISSDQPCEDTQTPFMIGATAGFNWAESSYFKGGIDDVRIFDIALSNQQIINFFNEEPLLPDTIQISCPGDTVIYTGTDNCYGILSVLPFEDEITQFDPGFSVIGATGASNLSSIVNFPMFAGINKVIATYNYNCSLVTCEFDVLVMDTMKPIGHFNNLTKTLQGGSANVTTSEITDWTYDNCQVNGISISKSVFDCQDIGYNPVTVTIEDAHGNVSQYGIVIEIEGSVPEAEIIVTPGQTIPNGVQNTIYLGYAAQSLDLTSGSAGINIWSPAGSVSCDTCESTTVSPVISSTYTLLAINESGCTDSASVDICVLDPRQYVNGIPGNKYLICHNVSHNPHTIAVPHPAVMPHLLQGDYLGYCGISCDNDKSAIYDDHFTNSEQSYQMQIQPNPFQESAIVVVDKAPEGEIFKLNIYHACGKLLKSWQLSSEEMFKLTIGSDLPAGSYIFSIESASLKTRRKMIKTGL